MLGDGLHRPDDTEQTHVERRDRPHLARDRVLLGFVALALVGAAWLLNNGLDSLNDPRSDAASTDSGQPSPTDSAQPPRPSNDPVVIAAVKDCRTAWTLQKTARKKAGNSLERWRTHIDAMNQLTAGKITLNQAKRFWSRSREGAMRTTAAFRAADLKYSTERARCAVPKAASKAGSAKDLRALRACADAVAAEDAVLGRARIAGTTWEHHLTDMEALRAGKLSPTRAANMWLANWRAGAAQMKDYDAAVKKAKKARRCPLT